MFPIILAVIEITLDVMVQTAAVVIVLRWMRGLKESKRLGRSYSGDAFILARAMVILFLGHVVQIALWAVPFRLYGEFESFDVAFYHSAVNYASLGYGDIVMSDGWRVVGALEAASGVLMFGVSTATFFALMTAFIKDWGERGETGPEQG